MTVFEILGLVSINNKDANKSLDEVNKKAEDVSKELAKKFESIGKGFSKAGETMTKIGSKITKTVTIPLIGISTVATKTAIDFVKLKESSMGVFEKMLGGSESAENMYQSLLKVAKASTYSQEAFLTAGKTLVGMGTSAQDTTKYLQAITDAVAGFGGSSVDIESLASVFGKVSAKGKVLTDDLNMLSERGVNGLQILAAHYNKTTDEMQEMVSKGMVPAKEGLDILCDGMENGYTYAGQFHQGLSGMAQQLKGGTLTGALDGLKSSFRNFSTELVGAFDNKQYMIDLVNAFGTALGHLPKLLSGITDAIAPTLQKVTSLINKFNEFAQTKEGQESLKKIGNLILKLAIVGPVLMALGKLSGKIGDTINAINKYKNQFNNIFGKITDSIKEWKDNVKTYFGLGTSYIKDGLKDSKVMFEELGNVFKGIGSVVFRPAINTFNTIKTKFTDFVTIIKDGIINKIDSIKDSLIDKFNSIKDGVITKITALKDSVVDKFNSIRDGIINRIAPIKGSVVSKFNSIKDGIINAIAPMRDSVITHFNNLKDSISSVVGKISSSVSNKFESVTNFLSSKFNEIGNKISGPFSSALEKGKSALGNFGKGFGAIGKGFGVAMKGVGLLSVGLAGISAMATASGIDIAKMADNMVQKVQNFANNLPNMVNQIVSQIQQKLPQIVQMIPQLVTAITQALQTIVTALPQILPPLIQGITQLITGLVQMLPTIIPILVSGASQLFMGIIQCLPQILPSLIEGFISLVNAICGMLPTLIPVLIQGAIQLFMAIVNAIDQIIPPLIATMPIVIQALIDSFPVLIPALINGAVQLFIAIVKAIPQIISMLVEQGPQIIKGLIGGMKTGLSSLGSAILDIGKNIVKGLWNGIIGAKDWLLNKLKSFGKSIVNGIKGIFGIHSPSTLFRDEIGKNLALGLGEGFTNEMENVRDEMQDAVPNKFDTNLEANFLSDVRKIFDDTPNNDYKIVNPMKTITGTNSTIDMFEKTKNSNSITLEARIDTLIEILLQYLPLLAKRQVCLDTGAVVGELTPFFDKSLGDLSDKKGRGR